MKTIPDTVDMIKNKLMRLLDIFYAICEKYGSRIGVWAWQKRWGNREKGTGYKK